MRFTIVIVILMIITINNIEAIRIKIPIREYIYSVKKSIHDSCNRRAYFKTNNELIYNCFKINITENNCRHLDNFTDYNIIRIKCSDNNNSNIGSFILMLLLICLIPIMMTN